MNDFRHSDEKKRWFVTGASGLLGFSLCKHLHDFGYHVFGAKLRHPVNIPGVEEINVNLLDLRSLEQVIGEVQPDVVVHCAGLSSVDGCEEDQNLASHLHIDVTKSLSALCQNLDAKLVYISTDHLWDGSVPYITEDVPPQPVNTYARTKYEGEVQASASCKDSLVVRTNFFGYGRPWRRSFSDWIIDSLKAGKQIPVFTDVFFTPIDLDHLSSTLEMMVTERATGVYNLAGRERVSKNDFAHRLASLLELDHELIQPSRMQDANLTAPRPLDMSLAVGKIEKFLGRKMPNLDECLATLEAK